MGEIKLITSDEDIRACFPVMAQLRPHLVESEFVERVRRQQQEGYELAALCDARRPVTVTGYRFAESLGHGKFMYVDDLITEELLRGKKYGDMVFDWLCERAATRGCAELRLDCGVQRLQSHRFYHRKGMNIYSHHFILKLVQQPPDRKAT